MISNGMHGHESHYDGENDGPDFDRTSLRLMVYLVSISLSLTYFVSELDVRNY